MGFKPTTPLKAEGCLIEPPVSEPRAIGTSFNFTATAEPPDEPPATYSGFIAFLVAPKYENSVEQPIANSSKFVLPIIIAPSFKSLLITVAE